MENQENFLYDIAARFVHSTGRQLFITGKAGTGKTTFLRDIREKSQKKMVVLAPTGVAAINAGAVTIHSFFQLPFGIFIPEKKFFSFEDAGEAVIDPQHLIAGLRINSSRKKIFQELEMIVIDEVSMLRADILDAIDTILRHFRRKSQPFGGVQMVYIGDLFQLPPVLRGDDWQYLRKYYRSPFFFEARALMQAPPLTIEFEKVYRQQDNNFIDLLNNIRHNQLSSEDHQLLKAYYRPDFISGVEGNYITLTTHNSRADTINARKLAEIDHPVQNFQGEISGDFNEKFLPAEFNLQLKEGAQVMFIKNDKGENRRFYNGKLGVVSRIDKEGVKVRLADSDTELLCEREVWRNIRYVMNATEDQIEEEEVGSFTQYPLRLAWAITIHKSQGLSFDRAVIDAAASFAPGQVYVALSRLRSLQGLVLLSPILSQSISTDPRILEFSAARLDLPNLMSILEREESIWIHQQLVNAFYFNSLMDGLQELIKAREKLPDRGTERSRDFINALLGEVQSLLSVAHRFTRQLEFMLSDGQFPRLYERVKDGTNFFIPLLVKIDTLLQEDALFCKELKGSKKYLLQKVKFADLLAAEKQKIQYSVLYIQALLSGKPIEREIRRKQPVESKLKVQRAKLQKGETMKITLQFFRDGNTVAEIAAHRNLATSTIESHLAMMVGTGDVEIDELLDEHKLEQILEAYKQKPEGTLSEIRTLLGETCSFAEIRAVSEYRKLKMLIETDGAE